MAKLERGDMVWIHEGPNMSIWAAAIYKGMAEFMGYVPYLIDGVRYARVQVLNGGQFHGQITAVKEERLTLVG